MFGFKGNKFILILSLVINVIMAFLLFYVSYLKSDIFLRALSKIGLSDYRIENTRYKIERRCLNGWDNTLRKMDINVDAVFYGNSITYESDFQKFFPNKKICNLGCNRDNLDDLIHRSFLISSVTPQKIFILGGINGLIEMPMNDFQKKYMLLVDTIIKQNPCSEIYLQSLLPVNTSMDVGGRFKWNETKIKKANNIIKNIAIDKHLKYIDLYSAYQLNDSLPRAYTRDGLHLYPGSYGIWARKIKSCLE